MNNNTNAQNERDAIKAVLHTLAETQPSHRKRIQELIKSISSGGLNSQSLISEIKKINNVLIQEQDKETIEMRITSQNVSATVAALKNSEHISAKQRQCIADFEIVEGQSPADSLNCLGNLCSVFAEDAIHLRSQSKIIVGDEHQKLKSSESNIIAGDVAWSSRQIIKSMGPMLHRVSQEFPENIKIASLHKAAKSYENKPSVDFFEAISLMEDSVREVTRLQGKRNENEAEYLKTFHGHLKSMHSALNKTIRENATFGTASEKEKQVINSIMNGFQEASENENDPVKLKKMIAENVNHMRSGFEKVMSRQDIYIKQQQRAMDGLRAEVRQQEKLKEQIVAEKEVISGALEDMANLSVVDELTQTPNRRAYEQSISALDNELRGAEKVEECGLILMDIDCFKKLNDTYGHQIGDKILQNFGDLIKKIISDSGFGNNVDVFRYGGEEFAIVYRGLHPIKALKLAEKCRAALEAKRYTKSGEAFQVTISLGVASYTKSRNLGIKVFEVADKALYKAKNAGRNVTVYVNSSDKFTRVAPQNKTKKAA